MNRTTNLEIEILNITQRKRHNEKKLSQRDDQNYRTLCGRNYYQYSTRGEPRWEGSVVKAEFNVMHY